MADNHPDPHKCMSKLNEHCQKNHLKLEYKDIDITSPSHDRVFTVAVVIGKVQYESATDKTKKEATARAAVLAWNTIQKQKKAKECANSASDSSDTTFSSSQELSSEASGTSTDVDLERKKTSDTFTQHTDAIQLNETSSTQNPVSPPSRSMKPKRKETPLAPKFSRTSKFTQNGRFLEEFIDIDTIGSGGFGNVFKAKNITDSRLCAIKRIRLSGKKDNGEREKREKREAKALAKLDHPHIIRYYSCWSGKDVFQFPETSVISSEQYDCLFIHMELCEKGNLSDWLDKRMENSCKDVSINLFHQIVEGVDYIHSMDFIHRDLKPLNVFFYSENHIKIGDFGLVTDVRVDVGQRTTNTGTVHYMAPEQEGSNYDKKVDIFPLGLILYEMLSPFFTHAEKYQEWPKIKEGKFPITFTEKFSQEASLIKKLLSKEPTQRPSAANILKILEGQPHRVHTY